MTDAIEIKRNWMEILINVHFCPVSSILYSNFCLQKHTYTALRRNTKKFQLNTSYEKSQEKRMSLPRQNLPSQSWCGTPPHTGAGHGGCRVETQLRAGRSPTLPHPPGVGFPPASSADPECSVRWPHPVRAASLERPAATPGRCGSESWGSVWSSHLNWCAGCTRCEGWPASHVDDTPWERSQNSNSLEMIPLLIRFIENKWT